MLASCVVDDEEGAGTSREEDGDPNTIGRVAGGDENDIDRKENDPRWSAVRV